MHSDGSVVLVRSMQTAAAMLSTSSSPGATVMPYVSRAPNQRLKTSATVSPSGLNSYSWSTKLPLTAISPPPSTVTENRSRMPTSAFLTLATSAPSR